jgi:hypothetical protein
MIFALHKFRHYLLGNKFVFYVDHKTLIHLVNKPKFLKKITKWLLLFWGHNFIIVYKPSNNNVVADALCKCLMS